jgi:hypothetical protein
MTLKRLCKGASRPGARISRLALLALCLHPLLAPAATPSDLLAGYVAQAGAPADAGRGQRFFTTLHGHEWSCSKCHGATPTGEGQHASTGKAISPLAPAANPKRFSDSAKSEKWFRRNCNDVVGRECSPAEKADVLAWLMSLK